ncbi:MAG: MopE-related protein [Pseudomonadota bacterium]
MRTLPLLLALLSLGCPPAEKPSDDTGIDDTGPVDCVPGPEEICDGVDNDCDGEVDEGAGTPYYADSDGDGYGDPDSVQVACEPPSGFVNNDADCDDGDPAIHPAAAEICDGVDNDCSGALDDEPVDAATWYADADGDGFGDPGAAAQACEQPSGYLADASDCDDTNAAVNPAAAEVCNGIDDDCDDVYDENARDALTWWADADDDGYGDLETAREACTQPSGWADNYLDCDDEDAAVNPAATEVCDGVDDDCDLTVDEPDAADALTWYADTDADGYGAVGSTAPGCDQPLGYVAEATDCDDGDAAINPAATEVCDGADNDCDGVVDEPDSADALTWYADTDADGYGDAASTTRACAEPSGYVADATDCDDGDASINPAATELCNGVDDDCDGDDDLAWFVEDFDAAADTSFLSINGDAYQDMSASDGFLELTGIGGYREGTTFFAELLESQRWYAAFTFETGGGSGADGLALAFLSETDPTLVGGTGGGIGYRGLDGYVVEFDTYYNSTTDPNGNHVALVEAATQAHIASDTSIPTLEDAGEFAVEVWYDEGDVEVWLDGTLYLTSTITGTAPADWLMGFTASTGSLTNYHRVDDVEIGCW